MPKSNFSYTQLFRHKFNRLVSINLFLLTLTIVLCWSWILPSYTQTPTPNLKSREVIIQEIKDYAERHVENDKAMDSRLMIDLYEKNSVGLTTPEITKIYEEEYTRLKEAKDSNLWEKIKDDFFYGLPWFAAIGFFILFIFKKAIQNWEAHPINTFGNWLGNQISGIRRLLNLSLKRYKKHLIKLFLFIILLLVLIPPFSVTINSVNLEAITLIQEIKDYAERHVENDKAMDSRLIIDLYDENPVGLTKPEITKIYEEEYSRLKKKKDSDIWEKINDDLFYGLGWLAALALFILLIFKEVIQGWVTRFINTVGN
ncbi:MULTISPECIES: hypothetical protein [unclassified Okeania]|uniref:hypothetical protein n=1 Tax=unclassified Okeania TaxID=2634635 RepID=UPI0013B6C955|nr:MULTISPECIES: hypothetical protein [unclassified Okeania]NES75492.1 hypothetical protein [Okeania sp. SIO1H4]NET13728.1 hypothetical protein [Okeania sp. SIO1H6]NET17916.1 hypothetical protein [Okeania sp. SIO1H5]NET92776.1 hypothetical protein [Okeania sp. SIO1H2]